MATEAMVSRSTGMEILLIHARTVDESEHGRFRILSILDIRDFGVDKSRLDHMKNELEDLRTGVAIVDAIAPDRPIIYVNRRFEDMSGVSCREIIGKNCRFLQGNDRDQQALGIVRSSLSSFKPCRVVLRNYRRDGSQFLNELFITPVFDVNGRPRFFVGLQRETWSSNR